VEGDRNSRESMPSHLLYIAFLFLFYFNSFLNFRSLFVLTL
jgi:hypothetical protein